MELSNINLNLPLDPAKNNDELLLNTSTTLSSLTTEKSASDSINTSFKPALTNEISDEMQKEVEYRPSQDIIQEKTQALSLQEEQRMQKIQQKELLINLQKTSKTTGTSYSRNMDESAVMNYKNKDYENINNKAVINQNSPGDDAFEDKIHIDRSAEELLNPQKRKNNNDAESALKKFEEQKRKEDNENNKKKRYFFDFEDDEIVDLDKGKIIDKKLTIDIERHPNINKIKETKEINKTNPALEKALRKDKQKNNTNKLRQKFNKN